MTKTCPDCKATVLSTSQPDRMGFIGAMDIVERGFKAWKDKPHNAKWFKRIDGTPIPNDLAVNIAEAIDAVLAATPAVGGEALKQAEAAFEYIRLKLINHLNEPERSAFWKAVESRDAIRAQSASPLLADEPATFEVEEVRQIAFRLSAKQQYRLAFLISENIGYALKSNDPLAELSVDGHPLADRGDVA